jgi:hypothetical protein
MAIDFIIDYPCEPKRALTLEGIVERLKGRERAQAIIRLFRQNGDERSPEEMGFEFTRQTPEGIEENRVIVVQELLDEAAALDPLAHHCVGCPANRLEKPFGCVGHIEYPVSGVGEAWLLDRMPPPDDTLVWLLLKQGVEEFKYDGESIAPMRQTYDTYFEDRVPAQRLLGEFTLSADQVFEMMFAVGAVNPNHAAILLLFSHAVARENVEAADIMALTPAPPDAAERFPFILKVTAADDLTIAQFKGFLHALYIGWTLDVRVVVDA